MQKQINQVDKVKKYYDATVIDFKIWWSGSRDLAMHFGYYDEVTKSHPDSLLKMNEVLAKHANISKKDKVLDAGCGYGGSAIWLAKNIGCDVVGITIVPYQVQKAQEYIKKYNIKNKVKVLSEDFTDTSFPNSSFNVIWGLESIVHTESKKDFIHEAFRLLKPKGRILICEYTLRSKPSFSEKEKALIQPWLRGWAMPSLLTPIQYKKLLKETGFKNIQVHDITEHVKPSLRRSEKLSTMALPIAKALLKLRIYSPEHFGNIEASFYQAKALKKGLWNFSVITAEKV